MWGGPLKEEQKGDVTGCDSLACVEVGSLGEAARGARAGLDVGGPAWFTSCKTSGRHGKEPVLFFFGFCVSPIFAEVSAGRKVLDSELAPSLLKGEELPGVL